MTPPGAKLIEDFVNTNELDEVDGEHLKDPAALSDWLSRRDLLPDGASVTGDDVRSARAVREALRKLLLANNGAPLDPKAVGTLNSAAERSRLRVSFSRPMMVRKASASCRRDQSSLAREYAFAIGSRHVVSPIAVIAAKNSTGIRSRDDSIVSRRS